MLLENGFAKHYDKIYCEKLPIHQAISLKAKSRKKGLFKEVRDYLNYISNISSYVFLSLHSRIQIRHIYDYLRTWTHWSGIYSIFEISFTSLIIKDKIWANQFWFLFSINIMTFSSNNLSTELLFKQVFPVNHWKWNISFLFLSLVFSNSAVLWTYSWILNI